MHDLKKCIRAVQLPDRKIQWLKLNISKWSTNCTQKKRIQHVFQSPTGPCVTSKIKEQQLLIDFALVKKHQSVLFSLVQLVHWRRLRWLILPMHEPEWWSLGNRETRTGHECFTARRPWLTLQPHRLWQRANINGLLCLSSALLPRFSPYSVKHCGWIKTNCYVLIF